MAREFPVITPEILDHAARLEDLHERQAPDEDRGEEIALRLQDWAGTDNAGRLTRYLQDWVQGMDFGSPEGGAWFWAHHTVSPATGRPVGNQFIAAAHAAQRNTGDPRDRMTTIESTAGGTALSALRLDSRHVQKALQMNRQQMVEVWVTASLAYSAQARGPVFVMAPHKHPWTVLADHEVRGLRRNPHVPAAIFTTYEGGRTHYHTNQLRALDVGGGWNVETLPRGVAPPGGRRHALQPTRSPARRITRHG